jgi:hypothetical protein
MSNRKPAGPATKSKNRQVLRVVVGAALFIAVLIGSATAQIVVNPLTGHRYEYVRIRGFIYWEQAQEAAVSRGGYLATITDSLENRIVAGLLAYPSERAFLGASDINDSCDWLWVTGEPWHYQNWAPGEPSGEEPCENSLRTSYELGGKWEADVGPLDGFIVEWNVQPNDTLLNLQQWPVSEGGNGHWYAVIPEWVSWYRADSLVQRFGVGGAAGHLATITSPQENQFILDHILVNAWPDTVVALKTEYWLGGERSYGGGWEWVTGEPFNYTNWADSVPFGTDVGMVIAMVGYGFDINPPLPGQWLRRDPNCDPGILGCRWAVIEFDTPADTVIRFLQWPVSEGGNGHWYAFLPAEMPWEQARFAAEQLVKEGVSGHLATITSQQENDFVLSMLSLLDPSGLPVGIGPHWLGGYDDTLWVWVTGEPFVYTNWSYMLSRDVASGVNASPILGAAMIGPPWLDCPLCPDPGKWIPDPVNSLHGSIVEFDTEPSEPRTLHVPQEYPTIQAAIRAARHGDLVLVSPGVYEESINFLGKSIAVRSAEGPLHTVITNHRRANLVTFDHGETRRAQLEGFTLRGGWMAVLCVGSSPIIRSNICVGQNVWNWAAIGLCGSFIDVGDPTGDPRISARIGPAAATLINNTIVHSANGGISNFSSIPPYIRNNIVAFNAHYGIHHQNPSGQPQPILGYNDVFGHGIHTGGPYGDYINIPDPGPGSISADPQFESRPLDANFALSSMSPCIDAGDPNPDFNDPDGSRNDMGAVPYEFGGSGVIPTSEWIIVYCSESINEVPPLPGSHIRAFDPQGTLCGESVIRWDGSYGFMPVYRDDPYTEIDEGCEPGDLIQFRINGAPVMPNPLVYWTTNGDVFEVCDFGYSRCLNIPLHVGWNLVSWNVAYESMIRLALDEIIGCVDVVQSFEQGGLVFDPDLDGFNTLTHVDYHHAYWIRMNCDAVLQVCGDQIGPEEHINLEAGWNLVSYWPEEPYPVEAGFVTILDHLEEAMGFDHGAQVWLPGMGQLNTLTELRPRFGYWTKVDEMQQLAYPPFGGGPFPDTVIIDTIIFPPDSGILETIPLVETSRNWMSVYGNNITVDGQPLSEGAVLTFCTDESVACGRGVYHDGALRFTPVYGRDQSGDVSKLYPNEGDQLAVLVNGVRVYPDLQWSSDGARVRLSRLTADSRGLPQEYELAQNYPNPFNPGTMLAFDVPVDGHVNLSVFNVLGQRVRTLTDRDYVAGRYELEWNGRDDNGKLVASGVYFYRLTAGESVLTKKMMLLK